MIAMIQRALARVAAIAALLLGAALAVVLGLFTLLSGLAIGLVAALAAWFGARSRCSGSREPADGPFGRGSAGSRPEGSVIDVEMREIEPGSTRGPASEPKESERSGSADDAGPDRPPR